MKTLVDPELRQSELARPFYVVVMHLILGAIATMASGYAFFALAVFIVMKTGVFGIFIATFGAHAILAHYVIKHHPNSKLASHFRICGYVLRGED